MGQSPQQPGVRNPSFHPNMAGMNGPMSNAMNGQSPGPPWQMMYQNRPPHMMGPGAAQRMPDMSGRMGMHGGMGHGIPPGAQPGAFPSFPGQPQMGGMSSYPRTPFGENGPRGMNPVGNPGGLPVGMNGPTSAAAKSENDSMVPNEILALLDNDSTTPTADKPKIEPVQCGVCQSQIYPNQELEELVRCYSCQRWFKRTCVGINEVAYKQLVQESSYCAWCCETCITTKAINSVMPKLDNNNQFTNQSASSILADGPIGKPEPERKSKKRKNAKANGKKAQQAA